MQNVYDRYAPMEVNFYLKIAGTVIKANESNEESDSIYLKFEPYACIEFRT